MARKGDIEIPIAVDTGGVAKSINNGLIEPLEDAEKALEKLGKADGGKDIAKQMDKAQDATKDLSKELDDARDDLKKLGYAARDAGDDTKKGMDRAKDGVEEVGREAESTAKEAAASFDGSAESIGDAFQEVAANAFAGFGPAGAVAGIAAAAGIGVLLSEWEKTAEAIEERTQAMYDDMLESGNAYLSAEFIQKGIAEVVGNQDTYNQALQVSKDLGADINDVIRAMAGDQDAVNTILGDTNAKRDAEIDAIKKSGDSLENQAIKVDAVNTKYGELTDQFYDLAASEDSAATRAAAAQAATSAFLMDAIRDAGTATEEIDEFGNRLLTLPDGEQVVIDAETGQAHQNLDRFKGDVDGITSQIATKQIKVTVDKSDWDNWRPSAKTGVIMAQKPRGIDQWV